MSIRSENVLVNQMVEMVALSLVNTHSYVHKNTIAPKST